MFPPVHPLIGSGNGVGVSSGQYEVWPGITAFTTCRFFLFDVYLTV